MKVTHEAASKRESNSPALSLLVAFKQNSCTLVGYRADSLCLRLTSFLVRLFPQLGRKRLLHRVAKKYCLTLDITYFCSRALYAFVFFFLY